MLMRFVLAVVVAGCAVTSTGCSAVRYAAHYGNMPLGEVVKETKSPIGDDVEVQMSFRLDDATPPARQDDASSPAASSSTPSPSDETPSTSMLQLTCLERTRPADVEVEQHIKSFAPLERGLYGLLMGAEAVAAGVLLAKIYTDKPQDRQLDEALAAGALAADVLGWGALLLFMPEHEHVRVVDGEGDWADAHPVPCPADLHLSQRGRTVPFVVDDGDVFVGTDVLDGLLQGHAVEIAATFGADQPTTLLPSLDELCQWSATTSHPSCRGRRRFIRNSNAARDTVVDDDDIAATPMTPRQDGAARASAAAVNPLRTSASPASASAKTRRRQRPKSPPVSPRSVTDVPNRVAQFDGYVDEGELDQLAYGRITVNGKTYDFRSGGGGRGHLPPGRYRVTRLVDENPSNASMLVDGEGYSFALSDKFDARVGDIRSLLRIHPDGGPPGTRGCIGIVGNADVQRAFRSDMLEELERRGGRFTLEVKE